MNKFAVVKQAKIIIKLDLKYEVGAIMKFCKIITEYIRDNKIIYLKEASDKLNQIFLSNRCFVSRIPYNVSY